jgi:magnesium transporter
VYVDGVRTADPRTLDETYECLRERRGMAWIGLYRPDVEEIRSVAREFELEDQLFKGDPAVSRRIYELSREVIAFQRATQPLVAILSSLEGGFEKYDVDLELRRNQRDVNDHVLRIVERADSFRSLLQNALTVHSILVSQTQNDEMRSLTETSLTQNKEVKKISAWGAIGFAPTLVGTVYGMKFEHMPEFGWYYSYPLALALMAAISTALYVVFKRRNWL